MRAVGHLSASPLLLKNDDQMLTFDDDIDAVRNVGPLRISFKRLHLAIRDPRLKRYHLIVLSHLMDRLNHQTCTAFPGRQLIADEETLSIKTVQNAFYDLRSWGYLAWMRRGAPGVHKGKLLHYTIPAARWSEEEIRSGIAEFVKTKQDKKLPAGSGSSKVPDPAGSTKNEVPARSGKKVPARSGDSNLLKELTKRESARAKNSASKKRAPSKPEKSRLPEDWTCPSDWRNYARDEGAEEFQIDFMVKAFKRHWTGPDAKNPMKADWKRTWENWVDREIARGTLPRHPPKGSVNGWHPQRPEGMPDHVWEERLAELAEEGSS